jgi:CRP-like cAMP-binding protein
VDPARILLQTSVFGELTHRDVEELLPHLTERRYDAGQILWSEGAPADALFILAEGMVKSHRLSREGSEVIVDLDSAVAIAGEVGLFHPSRTRQVNVTAMTTSQCLVLKRRPLLDFLARHPIAMERMLEHLAARTVGAAYSFTGLAFDDIRRRAARTLTALADEYGEPVPDGVRIRLELSQRTLGALVAASRENVNRALAPLVAGGVISQRDGHFVIHDRAALALSAGEDTL